MTTEHILDAIGQLDDALIQEAEEYCRPKAGDRFGRWLGLAASFAVVLVLGYGLTHLGMGGGMTQMENTSGAQSGTAGDESQASNSMAGVADYNGTAESLVPDEGEGWPGGAPEAMEDCHAIMVDGVLYWSTGEAVAVEVDESVIQPVASYTNGLPETDGQTNFSPDLRAQYAKISEGLVVRIDQEWILFDTLPHWERPGAEGSGET